MQVGFRATNRATMRSSVLSKLPNLSTVARQQAFSILFVDSGLRPDECVCPADEESSESSGEESDDDDEA